MKKMMMLLCGVMGCAGSALAEIILWQEDFSNADAWSIIANPSNDASVVSDGTYGYFSEPSPGLTWPAGPAFGPTNRIAFSPWLKEQYAFGFTVDSISGSMSFDFGLDCFSNGVYVATVWDIFPNQAFTGTTNINLGAFSFDSTIDSVTPKLTLHTGEGGQTLVFDGMVMAQAIPEPATLALFGLGGVLGLGLWRARRLPR